MSGRSSSRNRIDALERFVVAFDSFVALSQHMNTMNRADAEYQHVNQRVQTAQAEVTRARRRVGLLDGRP